MGVVRLAILTVVVAACGANAGVGKVRFRNQPVVWRVNDRVDLPNKPEERRYARVLYHVDGYVVRRLTRAMEVRKSTRAANVNALDEVPDSTWWTNRIGVREMTVDEIHRGPNEDDGPEAHKPWTITGGKVGGTAVGFLMKDARGIKYLLKFDHPRGPEMETAADVIAQRLLWACGYNVPEDSIVNFSRNDLIVADDATTRDVFGNKSRFSAKQLDDGLAKVAKLPDGTYRGLTSKYLPGIPIGPPAREGVRQDDPNDIIAHQDRRELRGAYAIFEWLNHTDLQEDNTLDMWHEDKASGTHYVMHYLIDFGKALGVMGYLNKWNWVGYTYRLDLSFMFRSLGAFGLWKRPYEDVTSPKLTGVGLFEADQFEPGSWRPNSLYWPLDDKDRFDAFWGAKILVRLSEAHIRAAVEEGKLSDPAAVDYMTKTLVARQRKTARYWFRQVAPLDRFEVRGDQLCFTDLTVRYQLEDTSDTRYSIAGYDRAGRATGWKVAATPGEGGEVCAAGLAPGTGDDGYTIALIRTRRGADSLPGTEIHLARDAAGSPLRVIGLWRK